MRNKFLVCGFFFSMLSCSNPSDDESAADVRNLNEKKQALTTARSELLALQTKIKELEKEIKKIDPSFNQRNITPVFASVVEPTLFEHKISVRGTVKSRKNIQMSAQFVGLIRKVYIIEGQRVKKGDLLVAIDSEVLLSTIKEYKTSLRLANVVYKKQKRLWEKKIGTEVQYLKAKNDKESLESKLKTANSQLSQALVRAPFSGIIDEVHARVGELATLGKQLVSVVSNGNMYLQADVSEKYVGRLFTADKADVYFPSIDEHIQSYITSVSQVVNPQNRTFSMEIKMPAIHHEVKTNQVVVLRLRDYVNKKALVVLTQIIQRDSKGYFIFCVEEKNGEYKAKKVVVETGLNYDGKTEITKGLSAGNKVVEKGFRGLSDNMVVSLVQQAKEAESSLSKK